MTFLKASVIVPSCNALHALSPNTVSSSTSYRCLSTRDSRYHQRRQYQACHRAYATVADHGASNHPPEPSHLPDWPEPAEGQSCPTPYQIFAISQKAPYSKSRFYELVKLYHPDRGHHEQDDIIDAARADLTAATRLERYRLVVAAHTILSDPVKRDAYDKWGAGWAGKSEKARPHAASHAYGQPGPFTSWHDHQHGNIWSNATWEDWERWRRKQRSHDGTDKEPQSQQYLQNSTFISIIMVAAAIGSSLNYNRAEAEGGRFLAARDAVHDQASKELRKVRQSTNQRAKDERIDWFVRNREASLSGYGVDELREEKARHILPPPQNCSPKDLTSDE